MSLFCVSDASDQLHFLASMDCPIPSEMVVGMTTAERSAAANTNVFQHIGFRDQTCAVAPDRWALRKLTYIRSIY
jgi:hypothetical protein